MHLSLPSIQLYLSLKRKDQPKFVLKERRRESEGLVRWFTGEKCPWDPCGRREECPPPSSYTAALSTCTY